MIERHLAAILERAPHRAHLAQVEGRSGQVIELAGRNQPCIDIRYPVGGNHDLVAENVFAAVEVKIGVLTDIGRRRLVRHAFIDDREHAIRLQPVGRGHRAIAGITRAPIGIGNRKHHPVGLMFDNRPVALSHAVRAAMQMRDTALVQFELVIAAIDREFSIADPVGATARRGTEIG
ncbi:hypothetical protein D3C80_641380 [compost metagenome]